MGNISIHPQTRLGQVSLKVSNLERSVAYYATTLGFRLIKHDDSTATLGGESPLLNLRKIADAVTQPARSTGLYHAAFLLPSRSDLARFVRHLALNHIPFGYADHLVSEAFYLEDPDGNGLEVYRDRRRDEWEWRDGQVQMANAPIDFDSLLGELTPENAEWRGMPDGTRLGHMHLRVGDLQQADAFYHEILGFDIVFRFPSALFMSAGGYHHHLGLNTWHSLRGPRPPANAVGLEAFTVILPDRAALDDLHTRLARAGWPLTVADRGFITHDPWDNALYIQPD